MRLLLIGDPHGDLNKLKKISFKGIDAILLTGDLGKADIMRKMAFTNSERRRKGLPEIKYSLSYKKKAFFEVYKSSIEVVKYLAKIAPVFTIYGNVEFNNKKTRTLAKELKTTLPFITNKLKSMKNVKIINNKVVNLGGFRLGGLEYFLDTCWVREFKSSNFKKRMKEAEISTAKAKNVLKIFGYVDVLICHQPPYGILDKVGRMAPKNWRGKNAGSKTILNYIKTQKPKYVFCGHIHEAKGNAELKDSKIYNLGYCGFKVIDL